MLTISTQKMRVFEYLVIGDRSDVADAKATLLKVLKEFPPSVLNPVKKRKFTIYPEAHEIAAVIAQAAKMKISPPRLIEKQYALLQEQAQKVAGLNNRKVSAFVRRLSPVEDYAAFLHVYYSPTKRKVLLAYCQPPKQP